MAMKVESVIDIGVLFKGVSIGKNTARIGVKIDRKRLPLAKADEVFCGHRLDGSLVLGRADESPGQSQLFDNSELLDGVFDCKSLSIGADSVSLGLTFSLNDINVAELAKYSNTPGRVIVDDVGEIPEDAKDDHEEHHVPGTLAADGPWREFELSEMFEGAVLKSLHAADIKTVGELHDWTASDKRLIDIKGIGEGKAQEIEDRMMQFWQDNQNADGIDEADETEATEATADEQEPATV